MKKISTPLLLLCATALSSSAEDISLTVCEGTGFNSVPVYGQWMDRPNHSQVIYPADMLKSLKDNNLLSFTFYVKSMTKEWTNEEIVVSLAEVEQATYDAENKEYVSATLTKVSSAAVSLAADATEWTVSFTTPYAYKGGNLLVDISNAKAGTSPNIQWFGVWQPATSYTAIIKGNDIRLANFLPKLTVKATSEALGARASVDVKELTFPLTFTDDSSELSVKVSSIGSKAVSGTVSVTGSDAFSTTMTEITGLEPETDVEIPVTFAPKATSAGEVAVLHIDLGDAGKFEVALRGAGLEVPTAFRQLFDGGMNYAEELPAGWTPYAVEVLADNEAEVSDMTTDYSAFPAVYRFSGFKFGNGEGIAWNHVNWAPSSELYHQYYYLVSPVLSGNVMVRGMFTDKAAAGSFIQVLPATPLVSGGFELGDALELAWSEPLGDTAWSVGTVRLPHEMRLAFFMKFGALDLVAADATTGVGCVDVLAPAETSTEVYNLSGCRVNATAWKSGAVPAGVYIVREGGKTSKILKK